MESHRHFLSLQNEFVGLEDSVLRGTQCTQWVLEESAEGTL